MGYLQNFSLKQYNFFSVDAKARNFIELNSIEEAKILLSNIKNEENIFFLGAGSNVLFINDFDGLVLRPSLRGMNIVESNNDYAIIEVYAGESWHHLVEICLRNNFFGLENLALIPGNIGGAVVQNIGAYGEEIKNFVLDIFGFDFSSRSFKKLTNEECQYSYRSSVFKSQLKSKFLILSAKFKLNKKPRLNLTYSDLQNELRKFPTINPDPKWVFDTICRIRSSKLPDVKKYPNAGSFFKNPILKNEIFENIKEKYPDLPAHSYDNEHSKIPAGWLIEKAGWKGKRIGNVGTYDHHSLVIINFGATNGKEIYDFANLIREDVLAKFGISLEFEVEIVGDKQ